MPADAVLLALHADDAMSRQGVMSRACRPGSEPRSKRTAGEPLALPHRPLLPLLAERD